MITKKQAIDLIEHTPLCRYESLTNTSSDLGDALRMAVRALKKRKYGAWFKVEWDTEYGHEANKNSLDVCDAYVCSECGKPMFGNPCDYQYCPKCGAELQYELSKEAYELYQRVMDELNG